MTTRLLSLSLLFLMTLALAGPASADNVLLEGDPGDGLEVVSSPDGAYSVRILGYIQPRLVFHDGGADTDLLPLVAGDPNDRPGFKLRRGRFGIAGTLGKSFRYSFVAGGSSSFDTLDWSVRPDTEQLGIHNAYVEWAPADEIALRLGADKTPFGGQQTQSSVGLALTERAVAAENITPGYDVGARLHGSLLGDLGPFAAQGIAYDVGVYSGDGTVLTPDDNKGMLLVAGVHLNFGDDLGWSESCLWDGMFGLRVGASTAINWERESRDNMGSVDLAAKIWRVSLRGEYLMAQREPTYLGTDEAPYPERFKRHGYLMQVGFMIVPDHLELAFRHDYYDDDREDVDDYSAVRFLTGGANVFFLEGRVKFQLDYIHRMEAGAVESISNDTFMAQATLAL